ncbi:MAG: hypothetical protein IPH60_17815 [Flavobacteriales bacterium]|nr:hypothetical protein [Flavobacteriales bacterium]
MSMRNDPDTGQFATGNSGRPKGTKNTRTVQWEELGKEITEANAGRFNELLGRLWDSADLSDQLRAAELFLKSAEFFKPKLQRIQGQTDNRHGFIPPLVAHDGVVKVPHNWPGPIIHLHREIIGADGKTIEEAEP